MFGDDARHAAFMQGREFRGRQVSGDDQRIGQAVRDAGIKTRVASGASCLSECVFVLAAGASRRLGACKALVDLGGQPAPQPPVGGDDGDVLASGGDQVVGEVRDHFGDKVLRSVIPRTVRLSEAPSFGQPITVFDPRSRGAIAYLALAGEILRREDARMAKAV